MSTICQDFKEIIQNQCQNQIQSFIYQKIYKARHWRNFHHQWQKLSEKKRKKNQQTKSHDEKKWKKIESSFSF